MTDTWRHSAAQIADAVRRGETSAVDVAEAHLARIESVNPRINAVVRGCADEARQTARDIDARVARGEDPGPLCGVPVTTKENVDQAGHPTTNGTRVMRDLIATENSPVVANLRRAGAVIVGRTNTPAFSLRWFTSNALHGATLNPRDSRSTPGGSSGGASAAVAAGLCAIGHGTDIAGSIRYPAYACGVQGLRPTLGRVPTYNASGAERTIGAQIMAVSGPIARSIADLRLGLAAMSAPDPRDPWWVPAPLDGPQLPRRAALTLAPDDMPVSAEVAAALVHAAGALRGAGWQVDERPCPPIAPAGRINELLWMADTQLVAGQMLADEAESDSLFVYERMLKRAGPITYETVTEALRDRARLLRDWLVFLQDTPLVLCPVSGELPFAQQRDVASEADFEAIMQAQLPQRAIPTLGLPCMTVTTGAVNHVPVGVQLVASRFREDILLDAGAVIEAASPAITVADPR